MSQWNLSVRLDASGSSLGRTLRQDANSARALARDITVVRQQAQQALRNVTQLGRASATTATQLGRVGRQARRSSQDLRRLSAEAQRVARQLQRIDRDIQVRISLDDGNIDRRSAATATALRAVRDAAQDTARALLALAARARVTASQLDDLTASARRANTALRGLDRRAQTLDGRLDGLSTRTRTLRGDMDDLDGSVRRVSGSMGGLRGNIGTLNTAADRSSGSTRNLMLAAVGLGTALIPIAASLAPIAAGLTAAGAGTVVYGLAIGSQVAQLVQAAEAQKKYDDAVREHGKGSQEAAKAQLAQQKLLQQMPAATREAAAALTVLKDEYGQWSDELADDTMPVVTKSLQLFTATLPKATPLVRGYSAQLEHMLDVAAGAMTTPGFDRFMDKADDFTSGTLARMTTGIVDFTTSMDTGEVGGNLEE
ncbi:hypothetical protein IQ62_00095, partial [Streptomyces scabiei]